MKEDETPQSCLERELEEELGVNAEAGEIFCESIYKYDHGEFKIFAISTKLHSTEFELRSHDKADWVSINDLLDYMLLPADVPIAEKIIKILSK